MVVPGVNANQTAIATRESDNAFGSVRIAWRCMRGKLGAHTPRIQQRRAMPCS